MISSAEDYSKKMADRKKITPPKLTQSELDDLAASLDICYAVLDNLTDGQATYRAALTICNKGNVLTTLFNVMVS